MATLVAMATVHEKFRGWSGVAMVLGKLPVPGRPTIWITVGQGPTALAVGAGWGLFGHFYSHLSFLSSFSLSLGKKLNDISYETTEPILMKFYI